LTKQKEKLLVNKCLEDVSNFTEIYRLYVNKIYNYCYYRTYNKELSEDITSDIFLKAIESFANNKYSYNENIGLLPWLYRIAHNAVIDNYKSQSKKISINVDDVNNDLISDYSSNDIDESLDLMEDIDKVKAIIKNFDDEIQSIIVLKYTEELSFREIAETLDLNESTVKMKFYRTLEYIKKLLIKNIGNTK
jgi:RNA polymerase sigma-70 factor, ECF subfamily